jgi:hypothetical protein
MTQHGATRMVVIVGAVLSVALGTAVARQGGAQDRTTLKAANGVAWAEFKGYEMWQVVAPSATDDGIKSIVANPAMIAAYRGGAGNGHAFPDGSMIAKIEWAKVPNPDSPYTVVVPGALKSVSFIEKDSKRFKDTDGWGYAQFKYDAASNALQPSTTDPGFAKTCHECHTTVKGRDFIFTKYAPR